MNEFTQDVGDLLGAIVFFGLVIGLPAAWLERRRKREPEILPPPGIPSHQNIEGLEAYRRKRAAIDRAA